MEKSRFRYEDLQGIKGVFERTTDDFYDKEGHMYGDTARRFSSIYGDVIRSYVASGHMKDD